MSPKIIYFSGNFLNEKQFGISVDSTNLLQKLLELGYEVSVINSERISIYGFIRNGFLAVRNLTMKTFHTPARDKSLNVESQEAGILFESQFALMPVALTKSTILRVHDIFPATHPGWFTFKSRIHFWLASKQYSADTHFLCNSSFTRMELIRKFPEFEKNISVYPCNLPRVELEKCNRCAACSQLPKILEKRYFITIGTIEPRKNYAQLLRMWINVSGRFPEHSLVIVGRKGWKSARVIKKLESNQICRFNIIYLDYCCGFSKDYLLRNSFSYISASLSEGFNIPLLEAIFADKKICVSDIPAHRELLHETEAYWFTPNDFESGLVAISKCIEDENKGHSLVAAQKRYRDSLSVHNEDFSKLLLRLVNSPEKG